MLKSELIEKNKNLIQQNGELMYLLEFGKLRCEDSNHQMIWEHDSNARVLKQRIEKAIEYIENDLSHIQVIGKRNRSYLLEILKGKENN